MPILYYKPTCPYCQRVLKMADRHGISFDLKNIVEDHSAAEELIKLGGKRQVPYMVDKERGVSMYESSDIIKYLEENYVH